MTHLIKFLLDLGVYFPPANMLSLKEHTMRHGTRNSHKLKVRHIAANMIEGNEYLSVFPGGKASENWRDEIE